jgi:histidyl-tRNA synthetase
LQIPYQINPRLVRGLDYYGHTAFEITSSALGAQATVCGGGRYNGLVEQLGGAATACIGWAMGLERLVLLMQNQGSIKAAAPDLYVISQGEKAEAMAIKAARELRQKGHRVDLDHSGSGFAKQMKRALKSAAPFALLIGAAEASSELVELQQLAGLIGI